MDRLIVLLAAGACAIVSGARVHPDDPCGEVLLGFSLTNVDSRTAFDGTLGGPRGEGKVVFHAKEGVRNSATLNAALVSAFPPEVRYGDVCGWTVSITVEGGVLPTSASFRRSAAAKYFQSGMEVSGLVDPAVNGGKLGFVSAVLLSFQFCELPGVSTTSILELGIEEAEEHGTTDMEAVLRFEDGLRYKGHPRHNVVYISGEDVIPCNRDSVSLRVVFSLGSFLRGDADGEGSVNTSDGIFILRGLFEEQRAGACPVASDANADGAVDISDAIYLLAYLFQGGPSPPAPFPDCGPDPVSSAESLPCPELPPGCG